VAYRGKVEADEWLQFREPPAPEELPACARISSHKLIPSVSSRSVELSYGSRSLSRSHHPADEPNDQTNHNNGSEQS
jgi:hypothetical protein